MLWRRRRTPKRNINIRLVIIIIIYIYMCARQLFFFSLFFYHIARFQSFFFIPHVFLVFDESICPSAAAALCVSIYVKPGYRQCEWQESSSERDSFISPSLFRKKEKKNSSIDSDRLLYTVLSPVTAAAVGTNVHIGLGYRRRNGGGFSKCWLS